MKMDTAELEEVLRIQVSQMNRMREENIRKANDILRRMFEKASENEVISISKTTRVNSYE